MRQYNVGLPLERTAIDIAGPLPVIDDGNRYIIVTVPDLPLGRLGLGLGPRAQREPPATDIFFNRSIFIKVGGTLIYLSMVF